MSYVFIGHGWNLDRTIDLTRYNANVIMLSNPTCLFDENRKHKQLLIKYGDDLRIYMEKLLYPVSKNKENQLSNEFCSYTQKSPELLLTSYTKRYEQSASFLQKIGQVSAEKVQKVMLLSEILQYLYEKEKGKSFLLIIYACRCPLDHFQMENIEQFGQDAVNDITKIIKVKNITILQNGDKGTDLDCEQLV